MIEEIFYFAGNQVATKTLDIRRLNGAYASDHTYFEYNKKIIYYRIKNLCSFLLQSNKMKKAFL